MTKERIEDIREIVLPFVSNTLLKTNYENLGKSDAEEFTRDFNEVLDLATKALKQEPKSEWEHDHEILKAYSDGANEVLDKLRAEIAEYGSIMVAYAITKDTKTDKGIEKLVGEVLQQAKKKVLKIIDKYKGESEG